MDRCRLAGERESLARLRLPDALAGTEAGFWLHPGLLDACFQVAGHDAQ